MWLVNKRWTAISAKKYFLLPIESVYLYADIWLYRMNDSIKIKLHHNQKMTTDQSAADVEWVQWEAD